MYATFSDEVEEAYTTMGANPTSEERQAAIESMEEASDLLPDTFWIFAGSIVLNGSYQQGDVVGDYAGISADKSLEEEGQFEFSIIHQTERPDYESMLAGDGSALHWESYVSDGGSLTVGSYTSRDMLAGKMETAVKYVEDYDTYSNPVGDITLKFEGAYCAALEALFN